ncbi:MAG: glycosyltransferase family 4 protein [Chloroflexi bacterium]|nr:glycosyltransferase family 4 protein [Chloroflexota bacterium]
MPKFLYISLMRLPTEKAHGLQIMQNCEAFAAAGCDVTLWVARRWNTRELRKVKDPFTYYGVEPNFAIRHIRCIDLFPLFPPESSGARLAFYLLQFSYALASLVLLLFSRADIYYSRDELMLALLARLKPGRSLVYEAHQFAPGRLGGALQRYVASRVGSVVAITGLLRQDLITQRGADSARAIVAHDGIRRGRFVHLPTRAEARRALGWHADAFIVGYVGRLHTLGMDKGVGSLVDALAMLEGAQLALVGGPDELALQLRQRWLAHSLPADRFHVVGQAPPADVPLYLRAFDVCAMPFPANSHFARYASPLKLFEYMAAGRAIVASDLPAWSDVVAHEETALLLPPDDVAAWADAIKRLQGDVDLRRRLGEAARESALAHYTWRARAERILEHIGSA